MGRNCRHKAEGTSQTFCPSIAQGLSAQSHNMAGGKKKKKAAVNPARGFATTSIASKPKVEQPDIEPEPNVTELAQSLGREQELQELSFENTGPNPTAQNLTPEEFEKQLENSDLQVLVEKHAQKSKRDALRQKSRLETERRVLRGQAENLNTRKWLPPELMEEILDLVRAEGHFTGHSIENRRTLKQVSEEELTFRLWTLQQALVEAGFMEQKVAMAVQHVLNISDKLGAGNKDTIWGMEESLEWLARECSKEELPDYDNWNRKPGSIPKSQNGKQ